MGSGRPARATFGMGGREPISASYRRVAMSAARRASRPAAASTALTALFASAILVAACGAGAPSPSASPVGATQAPTPTPTLAPDAIAHPTGAAEVVLRYEVGGGFVPIEFMANHVPQFTLYGDGRVVFVRQDDQGITTPDGVRANVPLRTAKLTEAQVQELLKFALGNGALGRAGPSYPAVNIADAPSTTFEIHADGGSKTVSVGALGMDTSGTDGLIRAAFQKLADRLGNFDQGGLLGGAMYEPTAYRGILFDNAMAQGMVVRDWPWKDLASTAFTAPSEGGFPGGRLHALTPDQVKVLGLTPYQGGIAGGLALRQADGTLVTIVVRPLLPDEKP